MWGVWKTVNCVQFLLLYIPDSRAGWKRVSSVCAALHYTPEGIRKMLISEPGISPLHHRRQASCKKMSFCSSHFHFIQDGLVHWKTVSLCPALFHYPPGGTVGRTSVRQMGNSRARTTDRCTESQIPLECKVISNVINMESSEAAVRRHQLTPEKSMKEEQPQPPYPEAKFGFLSGLSLRCKIDIITAL